MRIAHLADIHIQDRRRPEYAAVFARLYESLRREAPDLIVIAGDVFDNKMRASPHNLEDVAALLTATAGIAPVVLIAGNHDTNCLAPGSLDLLTPLVADREALRPPRLTYWRQSGVYAAHGCIWTVIATDGERPAAAAEQAAREAAPGAAHICLFHEEVNGALLPNGAQMRDFALTTTSFGQYDLALGGHIHLRQRFAARAAYCGSLVQQNIGESHLGHGYVLWEFAAGPGHAPHRTAPPRMRGVDIPNDHGFVRVELDAAGRDVTPRPLPGRPLYWELLHDEDAPGPLVAEQAAAYAASYGMPPRAVRPRPRRGPGEAAGEAGGEPGEAAGEPTVEARERAELAGAQAASRTLAAHEGIIRELLAGGGDESLVDAVLALHRERWSEPATQAAGGKFRLVRLEFDNLYAFGPGNVVDFTALEGCISGVIAPNHTGKSSLIEALIFALYEEHPRAPSKKDVIHRGAGSCRLTLDFELDGRPGRITKGMFGGGTQNSAASQYRFEYAGENRTRGGTLETLAEIEGVLGGAVNALASSFQLQGHEAASGGFIEASPAGRKKLIASVMALGSFEAVERATAKDLTECGGEVKALAGQFRGETVAALEGQLARAEEGLAAAASAGLAAAAAAALARTAAAAAQLALGAERGLASAAASASLAAAAALPAAPDAAGAAAALSDLSGRLGELTPVEEAAASAVSEPPASARPVPSLGELASLELAAGAAGRAAAAAAAEETDARVEAAGASHASLGLARAREAVAASRAGLAEAAQAGSGEARLLRAPARPAAARSRSSAAAPHDPEAHAAGVLAARAGPRPEAAARAAALAQKLSIGEITPAQRSLAARWDPDRRQRAEAIVAAAGPGSRAAPPPSRVKEVPGPCPSATSAEGPGVPYPALGERRGARPQPEALTAAAAVLQRADFVEHGRAYDERAAARWNPEEYEGLVAALERLSGAQRREDAAAALACAQEGLAAATGGLAAASGGLAGALSQLASCAPLLRINHDDAGAATADDAADDAADDDGLRLAQAWAAAATHAGTIKAQLRLSAGCEGCRHTLHILGGEDSAAVAISAQAAYHRILLAACRQAARVEEAARDKHASAAAAVTAAEAACRQSAASEAAQNRLAAAEVAKKHYEAREQRAAATATLEAENYWAAQSRRTARSQWELACAEAARAEAAAACRALEAQRAAEAAVVVEEQDRAAEQHRRVSAAAAAVETLEFANHWAAIDYEAWQRYDAEHAAFNVLREEHEAAAAAAAASRASAVAAAQLALAAAEASCRLAETASAVAEAALQRAAAAGRRLLAARAAADSALAAANCATAARSAAVAARAWWKNALQGCARAAEAHAAAAALAATARARAAAAATAASAAEAAARSEAAASSAASAASSATTALQREAGRLQAELERELARAALHAEASSRQAALKSYRAVLRPSGGIGDRLLERGRAALSRQINAALRELGARFAAEIGADYGVGIWPLACGEGGSALPASLGSGYQKFVLGLAARLAIWRLTASPRPDAFIVDEGFGACDEEYLDAMATALEALATAPGGPRLVFVVSHVDTLKARLERALEIEALPSGSRVANARPAGKGPAPPRNSVGPPPPRSGAGPPLLNPDPSKIGNVVCETCRQSLRASWAIKHLASAKHITAVTRAEKRLR